MKKLVLLMAVMFGMAFVSCTGCADKTVVGNDSIINDSICDFLLCYVLFILFSHIQDVRPFIRGVLNSSPCFPGKP